MVNTLFILIIISREGGETGVWENRAWVGWGMQERKRVRGGSSKRVGSRRNSCRGKLCNNAWYFGTENRLKEGSQWEKGQGYCTRGGRFGPPSLPYKCTCKNTSNWIQSKISSLLGQIMTGQLVTLTLLLTQNLMILRCYHSNETSLGRPFAWCPLFLRTFKKDSFL